MSILLKLFFQKIAEEHFQTHSTRTITLISDKDNTQKRKPQTNMTDEQRSKNPQQNFTK